LLSNLKKDKEDLYSKMAAVHQQLCDKAGRAEAEKFILSRWVVRLTSNHVCLSTPSSSQNACNPYSKALDTAYLALQGYATSGRQIAKFREPNCFS